ncbi:hypothetical protein PC117_g1992 [Phytophthora cactorum]|uniref:Beta-lactamase-related domain-containing protein n=3 Tax=Phytophthora cactorum TaxID=29920 RepID=A0A8T1EFI8_9STRA|nr:hypothetical protein PC117_g1992 [Phytophthora cactorum]
MVSMCWRLAGLFLVANWAGNAVDAGLSPLSPNIFDEWRTGYRARDILREEPLEDQIARYTREGRFPKGGRSLQEKIDEVNEFLDRELAIESQRGVGVSGAIVYQDKVLLSKGYGLSKSDDPSSKVTSTTLFQIGSVSKTFISFGIAILVEEGKLLWDDPTIFLPWAASLDSIRRMKPLAFIEPAHTLRGGHDYANANFAILGQVIKGITGKPWDVFLKERIWEPLGMTRTFASAFDAQRDNDTSYGHFLCGGDLFGPYDLVKDPEAQLAGHGQGHKIASGSTLSSSDDLATLLRLILNKGTVDGVTILKDPASVTKMTTGKSPVNKEFMDQFLIEGHQYYPDGNTLASGYGFDYVGIGQWGHAYVDKSGDTAVHVTRTGIAPDAQLGVMFMSNTQTPEGHLSYPLDHIRSYVMGVFLDVPKDILDFAYQEWRENDKLVPIMEGVPACGLRFWKNPPYRSLSSVARSKMLGQYTAQSSTGFFGLLEVREEGKDLIMDWSSIRSVEILHGRRQQTHFRVGLQGFATIDQGDEEGRKI